MLNEQARSGATIIGLHPSGTEPAEVKKVIEEADLSYPTLLATATGTAEADHQIAGYPALMFPYCLLVDSQGTVVDHGFLREDGAELISRLRELRQQADGRTNSAFTTYYDAANPHWLVILATTMSSGLIVLAVVFVVWRRIRR